jgi:RimJ/RimL family protein N-acetyltransferase
VLRPTYPIATPRLLLRPLTEDDLDVVYDIHRRPDVMRYLYELPRTREETKAIIAKRIPNTVLAKGGDELSMAVVLKETGQVIGTAVLKWLSAEHQQGEVGYVLHPDQHGHGYATEAAKALIDIGFRDVKLHRIIGNLDARNTASARVLEKAGMRREAHLVENEFVKGEWTDELIYALLRTEWEQAQQ